MKAPDKCYITREKNGVVYSLSFNDNGGLEYIRKDAVLEWLKQSKQEMEQDLKGSNGLIRAMIATAISSFQEVIEKIESL